MQTPTRHRLARLLATALVLPLPALLATGCGEVVERVPDRPSPLRANTTNFVLDVDPMMRGTVASESLVDGLRPVVVRGYGLVVGLQGTGGRLMPAEVRAMMVQELARRGIGNPATSPEGWTPENLLDSADTAIVLVEGVIPPGAIKGTKFDVRVSALPGTDVTSLEGGRLYTMDLRPGPLLAGSRQAKILGEAKGNIFINPFVEPGATRRDAVNRMVGRILDGGETSDDMPLKLRLATSSHTRSRTIQSAINSTFPRERGQRTETARGENADSLTIAIPPSFKDRSEEFIELVRHVPLDVTATETTALAVRRALLANPGAAQDAMWRFRALGKRALPVIQDLYTYPEEDPRMAALSAGAALDDALAVKPLLAIAREGTLDNRLKAVQLLGKMGFNPDVDLGLRTLLDEDEVDVRLAAYEALAKRDDPTVGKMDIDGKFDIHLVPSSKPMLYVAQSGRPTIALFGEDLAVSRPVTMTVWSGRLIFKSDETADRLEVFHRPRPEMRPEILQSDPRLVEFIPFLGHKTTVERPFPGIGLSYGETIGVLHQFWRQGYLVCDFKAEQDRILAAILRNQREDEWVERPEFDEEPDDGTADAAAPLPGSDLSGLELPPAVAVPRGSGDTVPR